PGRPAAPVAACPDGGFATLSPPLRFVRMTTHGGPPLEAYARLAVEVGLNLERGQDVLVIAHLEHAELVRAIARAAYEAGARYVDVKYADARLTRIRADLSPHDGLGWSPPHTIKQIEDLAE